MLKESGGPAFPWCGDLNECPTINLGMTLRDYFAAKAMQAEMAQGINESDFDWMVARCYKVADSMLEARK